jgi:hypothetical protein
MTRLPYLRVHCTAIELYRLRARAVRQSLTLSALVRLMAGIAAPALARDRGVPRQARVGRHPVVKVVIRAEDLARLHEEASAVDMTTGDYVRAALGLPRRQDRRRKGAPRGKRRTK